MQGGEIIKQLRLETNTKIKIEDVTVQCEDRVVSITGSNGYAPSSTPAQALFQLSLHTVMTLTAITAKHSQATEHLLPDNMPCGRSGPESSSSPMQEALIRVFSRIVDADKSETDLGQLSIARLMLLPPQIGSIMGKGGRTISQIRRDSGTNIRILQPGDMPPSAMAVEPHAQLVQVCREAAACQACDA